MIPSLSAFSVFFGTIVFAPLLAAQNNWFQPGMVKEPAVAKALQSIDDRSSAIVEEWIHLVEIPSPSGKEQPRASHNLIASIANPTGIRSLHSRRMCGR